MENMEHLIINGEHVLKGTINGSKVTVCFSDKPNPKVKDNIIEILTLCYEERMMKLLEDENN